MQEGKGGFYGRGRLIIQALILADFLQNFYNFLTTLPAIKFILNLKSKPEAPGCPGGLKTGKMSKGGKT
ncbi:MAG: hypothetical protein OP8BY_2450 [Candidatus Saccharicenans subterraneus]|uniref:Uncharacterized protein n=1 Tax=Candidatus Saccharicenans subterraneus TaxID=2508984 RepID=A0A3E2BJ13_9BACT|nr:MAG: hypothetical protein OP8BY_2450 [Candidatus Saccharicenans subterraneum]